MLLMSVSALLVACAGRMDVSDTAPDRQVLTVAELHANRATLKGQTVRVAGFLGEEQQTFFLVDGTPREVTRPSSTPIWCMPLAGTEQLWIAKEDLRQTWRAIRPRQWGAGVRVIVEGVFDDEIVPHLDEQGRANESIFVGWEDPPFMPGEYHGMGPLRDVEVITVLDERCTSLED